MQSTPVNSLLYGVQYSLVPGDQLAPVNEFLSSLLVTIRKDAVPKQSFGSNHSSHTAIAVPFSIADTINLQSSFGSLNLSSNIFLQSTDFLKASSSEIKGPFEGSSERGSLSMSKKVQVV